MKRMILLAFALTTCNDMSVQLKQKNYAPLVSPIAIPQGVVEFQATPAAVPAVTLALLQRGQTRFRIYCTPCHSELGDGRGVVVQRGFPAPPSYHTAHLRAAPPQYFYDVITSGYGAMFSFSERVAPADRWAIAAYIKALQRSQQASAEDIAAFEKDVK